MCSHAFMAMLKPLPSGPRRLAAGTLILSIMTAQVGCAFQPSFSSALPKLNPAMPCQHQAQHELQQPDSQSQSLKEAECLHLEPHKAGHANPKPAMQTQSRPCKPKAIVGADCACERYACLFNVHYKLIGFQNTICMRNMDLQHLVWQGNHSCLLQHHRDEDHAHLASLYAHMEQSVAVLLLLHFTFSTRKALMPLDPGCPVLAKTRYRSLTPPPLIKALAPVPQARFMSRQRHECSWSHTTKHG